MPLSRRNFLGSLLAAPAIVEFSHIMPVWAIPAIPEPSDILTLDQITRELLAVLRDNLNSAAVVSMQFDDQQLTRPTQINTDVFMTNRDRALPMAEFRRRFCEPIAESLSARMLTTGHRLLKPKEIEAFSFETPRYIDNCAIVSDHGLSLRGVQAYNADTRMFATRFDILYKTKEVSANKQALVRLATPVGRLPG